MHQTLLNGVRVSLNTAKLPLKLWAEALNFSTFLHNRTPRAAISFNTPYFKRYNTNYEFNELHEFGQHVIIYNENADKLQNKGIPGQFVGYDSDSKGYRVYWNQKVSVERNVEFLDSEHPTITKERIIPDPEELQEDHLLPREQRKRQLDRKSTRLNSSHSLSSRMPSSA